MTEILNGAMPKLHIESMQSVVPSIPTDPRVSRQIVLQNNITASIFRRHFNMIFYYKASDEDSGWLVAGWIKESLGKALSDEPLFAGRVRRVDDGGGGKLEVVPNDSGARLVETKFLMNLEDFLILENREELESKLVYWEDIDKHNPQFSPPFYVQVTNFGSGKGYSIGISCSLLLADPLAMTSFIKRWINIHRKIVPKPDQPPNKPLFYLPRLGNSKDSPTHPNANGSTCNTPQNLNFKFTPKNLRMDTVTQRAVALLCIEEAEREIRRKMSNSGFSLLMKEPSPFEDIKINVENFVKQKFLADNSSFKIVDGHELIRATSWDYLGVNGISFEWGNKPVYVSCWINSLLEEGLVILVAVPEEEMADVDVIVIVPKE